MYKIAVISDTHANLRRTQTALGMLSGTNIAALLHCGDVCSTEVLDMIDDFCGEAGIHAHAVLGNCDLWDRSFADYAGDNVTVHGRFADLTLGDHRVCIIHGDDSGKMTDTIFSDEFGYLFTGHTHVAKDDTIRSTRVINPGALHRANPPSFAIVDLDSGERATLTIRD
jgi:putative phosphoesterase